MILFVAADQGSLEGNRSGCLLAVFFGRMNRMNHLVEERAVKRKIVLVTHIHTRVLASHRASGYEGINM